MRAHLICFALGSSLLLQSSVEAQPTVPLGSEFQVNTYTTNFQRAPHVASTPSGDFVVVWESRDQDYSGYGVFGQRFDSTGAPVGGELPINNQPGGDQLAAEVAMDASGGFVVVWTSSQSAGSDTDNRSVQLRRFDASGTPLGSDQQVNTYTTGVQQAPAVALAPDGGFLVVWEGLDGDGDGIRGQLFNASGAAVGSELAINDFTTGDQTAAAVARAGDAFVVVWQNSDSPDDADGYGLSARRIDSSGAVLGTDFAVNGGTAGDQLAPAVSGGDDGRFVVSWHRFTKGGASSEIFARRFASDGTAQGAEFQVNTYTTGSQRGSDVARHASGNFVVTWGSNGSPGSDQDAYSVQARLLSPSGALLGDAFQVNTYTTSYQTSPRLSVDAAGRFQVVWASFQNIGFGAGTEGTVDDRGVRAQRLEMRTLSLAWPTLTGGTQDEVVSLPLTLDSGVFDLSSLAFAVDYDASCLSFDPSDGDMDGLPDAFQLDVPAAFDVTVTFDAGDTDGEIDVLIADVPPDVVLSDGVLGSLQLLVTCAAAPGGSLDASVAFSDDPPISAGDGLGQSVPARGEAGIVRVLPGPRGDCNGDRAVDAADLGAGGLELFDGDGDVWLDVPGGSFAGQPVGCDANADQAVDAGDISCIGRQIFAATCDGEGGPERPELRFPDVLQVEPGGEVVGNLIFTGNGAAINSLVLSLNYDASRLSFDPTDADMDGVPDAVRLVGGMTGTLDVVFDPGDTDGELDIFLTDAVAVPQPFADGPLIEVQWQDLTAGETLFEAVVFGSEPGVSFGDVQGRSVAGDVRVAAPILFADGFETGNASGWSTSQPPVP